MLRANTNNSLCFLVSCLLLLLTPPGYSAEYRGVVTNSKGEKLEGAIVSVVDKTLKKRVSVYTNSNGEYQLNYDSQNPVRLRARYFAYIDTFASPAGAADATQAINFTLSQASNEQLRQQLPAHVWVERIAKISPEIDREFRIECMMCHQQGNAIARWPQNREQWLTVFARMAHKNAMVLDDTREKTIAALLAAYAIEDDDDVPRVPEMPRGKATEMTVTEWAMAPGTFMHDIAVGPDGWVYGASGTDNEIWRLNPETAERQALSHVKPGPKAMVGDGLGLHTVLPGADGKSMWFTYAAGNIVSRYDIASDTMKVWDLSYLDGIYPHTLRFDNDGQVWFTITLTNQLGTINPETDELEVIDLPTRNFWQSLYAWPPLSGLVAQIQRNTSFSLVFEREMRPIAYGIEVTPDNKVWFSQYNNRRIGYYEKQTGELKVIDTPFSGPRRFRSDSKGNLWIPAFTDGRIYKYEPASGEFTGFDLPTGASDSVYAVAVDPKDDSVWGCGSNSDTMLHLEPESGEFTVYRFPSIVTFCREISFDSQGNIWTSYSNSPTSSIEGGTTSIVRLTRPD